LIYVLYVNPTNKKEGIVYGWCTGYCFGNDGYLPKDNWGSIYVPKGFVRGELVFCGVMDWMITQSKFHSLQFFENLRGDHTETKIALLIDNLRGFNLVGRILWKVL